MSINIDKIAFIIASVLLTWMAASSVLSTPDALTGWVCGLLLGFMAWGCLTVSWRL
jgi:hypothetical protein